MWLSSVSLRPEKEMTSFIHTGGCLYLKNPHKNSPLGGCLGGAVSGLVPHDFPDFLHPLRVGRFPTARLEIASRQRRSDKKPPVFGLRYLYRARSRLSPLLGENQKMQSEDASLRQDPLLHVRHGAGTVGKRTRPPRIASPSHSLVVISMYDHVFLVHDDAVVH